MYPSKVGDDLKRVLIAGATGALGSKVSIHLSSAGFELILLGRDESKLVALQGELPNKSSYEVIDVVERIGELEHTVRSIAASKGDIFGLVSLLGALNPSAMSETKAADWQKSLDVNFVANAELLRGFSKCSFSNKLTRRVVFLSSVAATRGDLGLAAYAASKAALESMVRSAAVELSRKKIAVNALRLGLIQEGMGEDIRAKIGSSAFSELGKRYPLGLGKGDELGSAIYFLLTQDPAWMTGSIVTVDGGFSTT